MLAMLYSRLLSYTKHCVLYRKLACSCNQKKYFVVGLGVYRQFLWAVIYHFNYAAVTMQIKVQYRAASHCA